MSNLPVTLKIGGTTIDLDDAHCEVLDLRKSFAAPFQLTLRRYIAHDDTATWQNEDTVELLTDDGTTRFEGRIKENERSGSVSAESITYTCLGLREQANRLTFTRSIGGSTVSRVVYNCPDEEEEQELGYVAVELRESTVGEIIRDILDTMTAALSGVIGDGTPQSCYTESDLTAMKSVPGKFVLDCLGVDDAILEVLRHEPDFACYADPHTHRYVFVDLTNLAAKNVAGVNDVLINQSLAFSTGPCYTACLAHGSRERHDVYDGSLTADWDRDLEADWGLDKMTEYPDTYGKVWRYFRCNEAIANGGIVMPTRIVGDGQIVSLVTISYYDPTTGDLLGVNRYPCHAARADDTHLLINFIAAVPQSLEIAPDGTAYTTTWEPAQIAAWYTYGKAPVFGRYPAEGYTGSAYTNRGLERIKYVTQEDRGKEILDAKIEEVVSANSFRISYAGGSVLGEDELAGLKLTVNDGETEYEVESNYVGGHLITLTTVPSPALQEDDWVHVVIRDDTAVPAGESLSILEEFARAFIDRYADEQYNGTVPLSDLDWTIGLGQMINFTGTENPAFASLNAALVEIAYDIGTGRTSITLTNERSGLEAAWSDIEERRRLAREAEENQTQIRRLWRETTRARRDAGARSTQLSSNQNPDDDERNTHTKVVAGHAWTLVHHFADGLRPTYTVYHDHGDRETRAILEAGAGKRFDMLHKDAYDHLLGMVLDDTVDSVVSGDAWIGVALAAGVVTVTHNAAQDAYTTVDTRSTPIVKFDAKGHYKESMSTALACLDFGPWWRQPLPDSIPMGPIDEIEIA